MAFVIGVTSPDVRWPMAATGALAAVFMVVRGFAAELHAQWASVTQAAAT